MKSAAKDWIMMAKSQTRQGSEFEGMYLERKLKGKIFFETKFL
jgi:hypothetical protein